MTANTVRHVVVGTAGHVDHGKTTLIRALTGIDTDRLAEEKARGMTIDLGFAFLDLPGDPPIRAGIVDVPGHEKFVKNMLAGAGGIDVALVVVAADEGPMPQTREHLDILTVLGVAHGVVALTKTDLADSELAEIAAEETRSALAGTPLEGAPVVPVSAQTGEGLSELKVALARACAEVPPRDERAPFRLPVDRVFSVPGAGTVVTGTLVAGTLQVGDAVSVQPQGLETRARSLQTHNEKADAAGPGTRVAVNLPGVEVAQIERGAVLCPPGSLSAATLLDVQFSLLSNAPRPLRHRERVRVHLGTGEILARVQLLSGAEVGPGSQGVPAQLLCETPAAAARGERFVVRTYSPVRAVGGGAVLDASPARRHRRGDAAALALFEARGETDTKMNVYAVLTSRHADFSAAEVAAAAGLDEAVATVALEALVDEDRAEILSDGRYLSDQAATRLRETTKRTLTTYHRQNPYRRAMPRRGLLEPLAKAAKVSDFNALVTWLVAQEVIVAEEGRQVRLPGHEVVLPAAWRKAADEMLAIWEAAGFTPPSPGNFQAHYPRDVNVPTILNALVEEGKLVRLDDDLYLPTREFEQAKAAIRRLAGTPEGITVGSLRDALGSSRKVTLPLLEYLDAQKFTQRVGDARVLVES